MGYNTSVTGELKIEPPLTYSEFKDTPFFSGGPADDINYDVRLHVDEETVETPDGPLVRMSASALVPRWDDSFKAYHLIKHVQAAIDAFPGHTVTGRLDCEGEENADMWRVVIRDGRAVKITPRLVWPDEGEE